MLCRNLGELVEISIGRTPSRNDDSLWDISKNGHNIWLSIADLIVDGKEVFESKEYISDKAATSFTVVPKGTLLVSFKLTLGRIAFAGTDLRTNEAIAALHNSETIVTNDYLYWYLQHFDWKQYASADQKVKGLTLNKEKLKQLPVYYPESKDAQREIVSKLNTEFERILKVEKLLKENLENVDKLQKSILSEAFKFDTHTHRLIDICLKIFAGGDVPPKESRSKERTGTYIIPIFTNGEKDDGLYGYTDIAKVDVPALTISARGTIGFSKIRWKPFYPAIRLITIIPYEEKVDLEYLYYFTKSIDFSHTGTSIPQLTVPMIKAYSVPLPVLSKQKTIAKSLSKDIEKTEILKSNYVTELDHITELRRAILTEAFSL